MRWRDLENPASRGGCRGEIGRGEGVATSSLSLSILSKSPSAAQPHCVPALRLAAAWSRSFAGHDTQSWMRISALLESLLCNDRSTGFSPNVKSLLLLMTLHCCTRLMRLRSKS